MDRQYVSWSFMSQLIKPIIKYICVLGLLFILFGGMAHAEFRIQPALMLGEEYNDNILLQNNNPEKDYITYIDPSFTLHYQTSLWLWDGLYSLEYRYFDKYGVNTDSTQTAHLRNLTEIIHNFFYFEGIEDLRRVSIDVTNDFTQQSPVAHQTDQNTITLNPYMVLKPTDYMTVRYGHTIVYTRYTTGGGVDRTDNIDYLESSSALSSSLTFTVGASQTLDKNDIQNYAELEIYTGLRYAYGDNSALFGRVGVGWFDFQDDVHRTEYEWNVGINHHVSPYLITLETSVSYGTDPLSISTRTDDYRGIISRETQRSTISVTTELQEYKNIQTNVLMDKTRSAKGSYNYRFTHRTSATIQSTYSDMVTFPGSFSTYMSQSSVQINYQLTERIAMDLLYSHIRSYSPVIAIYNYRNNREVFELRMTF